MSPFSKILLSIAKYIPRGYWRVLSFAAARDDALWDYPISLKCCPDKVLWSDLRESVYTGIFRSGEIPHQQGFDSVVKSLINEGDCVYDVGANIGYTTMLFSMLVGKSGSVISLEPVPKSFNLLRRTCEKNLTNTVCLNIAASDERKQLKIYVPDMLDTASSFETADAEPISVEANSLDSMIKQYGFPQVIKIDVEGFEATVIKGMEKILRHEQCPIIIYEALDTACRQETKMIVESLSLNNYSFFRIGVDGKLFDYEASTGSSDYLAVPNWAKSRLG